MTLTLVMGKQPFYPLSDQHLAELQTKLCTLQEAPGDGEAFQLQNHTSPGKTTSGTSYLLHRRQILILATL